MSKKESDDLEDSIDFDIDELLEEPNQDEVVVNVEPEDIEIEDSSDEGLRDFEEVVDGHAKPSEDSEDVEDSEPGEEYRAFDEVVDGHAKPSEDSEDVDELDSDEEYRSFGELVEVSEEQFEDEEDLPTSPEEDLSNLPEEELGSDEESELEVDEPFSVEEVSELEDDSEPVEEVAQGTLDEVDERILAASRELETMVQGVIQPDANSLATTEIDIMEAKKYLSVHKLRKAKHSVKKAEKALLNLEEDVLYLRRSIAMLHRLLKEKKIDSREAENILLRLRSATSNAEVGDVGQAATDIEFLVDDLIGGNTSNLNPFFFRHFWLGVDTRWPAGGDTGVLLIRLINDGPIAMPAMKLSPPVPDGWMSEPSSVDLPIIAPGGNLPLRFDIKSEGRYGADEIPLSRKLAISTGYEMRSGEIMVTIRAQNCSMEPLTDVILTPWLPPGYTTAKVPFVERLSPDEVAMIRMPLTIDMGTGGNS